MFGLNPQIYGAIFTSSISISAIFTSDILTRSISTNTIFTNAQQPIPSHRGDGLGACHIQPKYKDAKNSMQKADKLFKGNCARTQVIYGNYE